MKKVHYLLAVTTLCLGFNSAMAEGNKEQDKKIQTALTPEEFNWVSGPDALPKGARMVVLEGDPSKSGPLTVRIKIPANYKIPAHTHPTVEHVTVLQGTLYIGEGDKLDENQGTALTPGSFAVIPKKVHHFARTGKKEVIMQLHGMGPWGIEYISSSDDPRKNKNKNKNKNKKK